MLRIRPYKDADAKKILSWSKDELSFYKWNAGVAGKYPLTEEQFGAVKNLMPFTMIEDNEVVGFFTFRDPNEDGKDIRFGFVIVDPALRGKGYGKKMLQLGIIYAKEVYCSEKVSLGVFENNEPAYRCYKSVGFREKGEIDHYEVMGETWNCIEMELE